MPAKTGRSHTIARSACSTAAVEGASSTANVQQQWVQGDTVELRAALTALREALELAQDVDADQRSELIADVDGALAELEQEKPNRGRLLRWLGCTGAAVQTAASVQLAYAAVQLLAWVLGLSL